jgi:1-acyl-sn-glycerol-3-phosphate acyltransferase
MGHYKRFAVFLIPLLLLSTLVAVSHHHENTADNPDCPICIASNHQSTVGALTVSFDGLPILIKTRVVVYAPAFTDTILFFSRGTRGPPA